MDTTGIIVGLVLFAVFVTGYIVFLALKGTPKFEQFLGNVSVKIKNITDKGN